MTVLEKIRKEIEQNRDEWIKGQDAEWHTYNRCLGIIDKYAEQESDIGGVDYEKLENCINDIKSMDFDETIIKIIGTILSKRNSECEDAVNRQAVKEVFPRWKFISHEAYLCAVAEIDALPSVRPQEQTGKWIMSDDGLYRPICDNCGAHPWKGYIPTVEEATERFKYCPNCGCHMFEPQESEDKG